MPTSQSESVTKNLRESGLSEEIKRDQSALPTAVGKALRRRLTEQLDQAADDERDDVFESEAEHVASYRSDP